MAVVMPTKKKRIVLLASSVVADRVARALSGDAYTEIVARVRTENEAITSVVQGGADALLCDVRLAGLDVTMLHRRLKMGARSAVICAICEVGTPRPTQYVGILAGVLTLPTADMPSAYQVFQKELAAFVQPSASPTDSLVRRAKVYPWRPGAAFATSFAGVVAIGASAGGTEAVQAVLTKLPANMPGTVVTLHMPPVFTRQYAERLNQICAVEVREAVDFDEIRPGLVLIAPGGMQMRVQRMQRGAPGGGAIVRCGGTERVSGHCPSVDALFESVAQTMSPSAIGVILTGMGSDGANGLLSMRRRGSYTYGQDEATAMVYGMPKVAYEKGAVQEQLPLHEIPLAICSRLVMGR